MAIFDVPAPPGADARVEGPPGDPDPTLPLIVLLHGMGDDRTVMTNPLARWGVAAFDKTATYPPYTDRGFQPFVPPALPVRGFFMDPSLTSVTSWQRALINAGFTTLVYDQSGPLIANDVAQLTTLAAGPLSTKVSLASLRIAFVCHSRGGLVARAFLVSAASSGNPVLTSFLSRVTSVVTLHSPHLGSGVASLAAGISTLLARIGTSMGALGVPGSAFVSTLAGLVLSAQQAELVPGTATASIAPGEPVPGVTYHTFGGTSTTFARLWADHYTPESYVAIPVPFVPLFHLGTTPVPVGAPLDARSFLPALGALAVVPHVAELAALVTALVATTPELDGLFGDLLVTDARSRLPFSASHTTNQLNHAEALWDRTLQAQVVAILSRLRSPISAPSTPLPAVARIFPYPALSIPVPHVVTAFDAVSGATIGMGTVVLSDIFGTTLLRTGLGVPFPFAYPALPFPLYRMVAELGPPYGTVPVDLGRL